MTILNNSTIHKNATTMKLLTRTQEKTSPLGGANGANCIKISAYVSINYKKQSNGTVPFRVIKEVGGVGGSVAQYFLHLMH